MELRSFLGLYITFRRFITHFARIADERNKKLLKNQSQKSEDLTDKEKTAMKTLER